MGGLNPNRFHALDTNELRLAEEQFAMGEQRDEALMLRALSVGMSLGVERRGCGEDRRSYPEEQQQSHQAGFAQAAQTTQC